MQGPRLKASYGWGLVSSASMPEDWVPAYRWDKPGSPYYHLRPDRLIRNFHYMTDPGVRLRYDLEKIDRQIISRGVGGPSGTTPASTILSKASSGRAMAQAKKSGGPRQRSQRGGRARGKCPKGHYWSYKKKKCVKSKF